MSAYYMLLTATGQAKVAAHMAGGAAIQLADMALGDGGGAAVVPTEGRAELYGEVHRQPLTSVTVDPANPNWLIAESILSPDVGGWTIREIGLYDTAGDLIAYGNFPASYKPQLDEGSAKELIIRAVFEVASTSAITLTVDPSIVFASQSWVQNQGYATQLWVAAQGYATQAWVTAKSYATEAWVTAKDYASKAWVAAQGFATQAWVTARGYVDSAANLGTGAGQVLAGKTGATLNLRSLRAGPNMTITQDATSITLTASGVTTHADLSGLDADDHPQYLTQARADARYAPLGARQATGNADHVRIPIAPALDWMIQQGRDSVPASGAYSSGKTVTFPRPFAPGSTPCVTLTPVHPTTAGGPPVALLTALPTAAGFQVTIDIAEGDSQSPNISAPIQFLWQAQGLVDDAEWVSGAAITYSASAGTPATATINVASGTYRAGQQTRDYEASSATLTGAAGSSVLYYLYYADPDLSGGSKALQVTTDPAVPFATAGNIIIGQVQVAYPASGSGSGGGSTGGGGGGGWCVGTQAWVIGRNGPMRAGAVQVGDELLLCDPDTGEEAWGTVTHAAIATAPGICMRWEDGGSLTCSATAPIPVRGVGYVQAAETCGRIVPTRTLRGDTADATVQHVAAIGQIEVMHITVGDRCFWAGDDGEHYVLHHNLKQMPE